MQKLKSLVPSSYGTSNGYKSNKLQHSCPYSPCLHILREIEREGDGEGLGEKMIEAGKEGGREGVGEKGWEEGEGRREGDRGREIKWPGCILFTSKFTSGKCRISKETCSKCATNSSDFTLISIFPCTPSYRHKGMQECSCTLIRPKLICVLGCRKQLQSR